MGYMEATESLKYPFITTRDTSPSRAVWEVFKFSPSDGCPATATCLASTQALRSRRVSSASKISNCVVAHRSDRCPTPVRPSESNVRLAPVINSSNSFTFHFTFHFQIHNWYMKCLCDKKDLCPSTWWSKRAKHSWWQMSLWPQYDQ
jgi:hypothetical protein